MKQNRKLWLLVIPVIVLILCIMSSCTSQRGCLGQGRINHAKAY